MKSVNTAIIFAACAAVASSQVIYDFTCSKPNAAYCAGDSLQTNIIIRCIGTVGQPGNCNDNLDGEPPMGDSYSPCWQSSSVSGDAACSKNGVVYGGTGNYNGTFTLGSGGPTGSSSAVIPLSTGTNPGGIMSGGPVPTSNGTLPMSTGGSGTSATATPVGPSSTATTSAPATFTGAASLNTAGALLAAGGVFAAYFL